MSPVAGGERAEHGGTRGGRMDGTGIAGRAGVSAENAGVRGIGVKLILQKTGKSGLTRPSFFGKVTDSR